MLGALAWLGGDGKQAVEELLGGQELGDGYGWMGVGYGVLHV